MRVIVMLASCAFLAGCLEDVVQVKEPKLPDAPSVKGPEVKAPSVKLPTL